MHESLQAYNVDVGAGMCSLLLSPRASSVPGAPSSHVFSKCTEPGHSGYRKHAVRATDVFFIQCCSHTRNRGAMGTCNSSKFRTLCVFKIWTLCKASEMSYNCQGMALIWTLHRPIGGSTMTADNASPSYLITDGGRCRELWNQWEVLGTIFHSIRTLQTALWLNIFLISPSRRGFAVKRPKVTEFVAGILKNCK